MSVCLFVNLILTHSLFCHRFPNEFAKQDDSLVSSAPIGSTATMEDSVVSSQFGSQSGSESGLLGSVNSLDDLDSAKDKADDEDEDEDTYPAYFPERTKEVSLLVFFYYCLKQLFLHCSLFWIKVKRFYYVVWGTFTIFCHK